MAAAVSSTTILYELAIQLPKHVQRSGLLCPFCSGGDKKEKTFSMKRTESSVSYICHRASCGKRGNMQLIGPAPEKEESAKTELHKFSKAKLSPILPNSIVQLLVEKYHYSTLDIARLSAEWCEDMDRIFIPIFSYNNINVGGVFRSMSGEIPKAYTYHFNLNYPSISFYNNHVSVYKNIIIVEDQLSACRAANTATAVALHGTNLNLLAAREICHRNPNHVVICLDGDAFNKGLQLQEKWGGLSNRCTIVKPPKDLKDMPRLELQAFIREQFGE